MKQTTRIVIAKDTLAILEAGAYINRQGSRVSLTALQKKAVDNTLLYQPQQLATLLATVTDNPHVADTHYEVQNETTLEAARRLCDEGELNVLCLNFASAKNPGGGFLNGALAQEESIARASGLYPCLLAAKAYYEYHRNLKTCLYSDHMIYSPGVPVFKDEEGFLLDKPVCISIVTSAAVNAGVVERNEPENIPQIIPVMQTRIKKLLALCQHQGHETLVLGAWGCGVFRNDPQVIAGLFAEALKATFAKRFRRVVFAVKTNNSPMIAPFEKNFLLTS